jgi:hypothetical protein
MTYVEALFEYTPPAIDHSRLLEYAQKFISDTG